MLVSRFMTRNPVTVTPDASVREAALLMEERGFRHLPVERAGELVGLVSDRDILLGIGGARDEDLDIEGVAQTVEDVMRTPVICVESDERGAVAAARMIEQKVGALPVPEDGRLVGIVTETNLVKAFRDLCRDPATADTLDAVVEEVMHSLVVTMSPSDTLEQAIKACSDWRIRHIPVMDDDDELVGIVSDRDIRMAVGRAMVADARAQKEGRMYVEDQRVGDIMSSEVITIEPTDMLSAAVPLMMNQRVSALPVSLEGMLMGIITRTDILEHYAGVA
jgi:acetoin utilization protein AcuB